MHSRVTPSSDGAFVGGKKVDDLTLVHSCTNANSFVHILKVQTQAAASSKKRQEKDQILLITGGSTFGYDITPPPIPGVAPSLPGGVALPL